ncbi:hypothetical protein Lalb_Chr04g0247861 [Lupinus albus]|uniref:Uncharacterized protein n=1 Tax=Lupinus albus TaxID=3870 RepID=A0A6A4QMQ5_LUPAL|nr:hypothetical protein Lalb_Chr04g0247861 [Lupinus albus]
MYINLMLLTEEREHNPGMAKESLPLLGVCSLFFCHHHTDACIASYLDKYYVLSLKV